MIASILTILAGIPGVLKLIDKWVEAYLDWKVAYDNSKREKAVDAGIEKAKKTKDTSKIEDAFK